MKKVIEDISIYLLLVFQPRTLIKIYRDYSESLEIAERISTYPESIRTFLHDSNIPVLSILSSLVFRLLWRFRFRLFLCGAANFGFEEFFESIKGVTGFIGDRLDFMVGKKGYDGTACFSSFFHKFGNCIAIC